MISLQIKNTKSFMNTLLVSEQFDSFEVEEATITTFNTFYIDGHIVKDFYTLEEIDEITTTENLDIYYSYVCPDNISIHKDLEEKFNNSLEKDLSLGFTTVGPHRDDIVFKINGLDCRMYASQGQQRTVSLVVKLSLMEVIKNEIGEYPILFIVSGISI